MLLGSKYGEMNDFYTLLNAFINTHEATTAETKICKDTIMKNINQLYNKYFNTYKKNYYSEKVKVEEKKRRNYKHLEIIDNGDKEPKSTKKKKRPRKKKPMEGKIYYALN